VSLFLCGLRNYFNAFLSEHYVDEFNCKFQVPAPQRGTAFPPCPCRDLDLVFSQQFERTVDRDNTVEFDTLVLQIEPVGWTGSMPRPIEGLFADLRRALRNSGIPFKRTMAESTV
jgi:hypothetical protein